VPKGAPPLFVFVIDARACQRSNRPMRQESVALTSIRGFAALWVVAMHFQLGMADVGYSLWPGLAHYGYVGVDIFFILSGFILTAVYRGIEWRGVGAFLTRRVFRVYPMHLAVLAGMLVVWIDAYLRFGVHNDAQQLRWLPVCALLLQPFVYHRLMWNAVTWSISMELVCYLLFPIVIMRLRHAALPILIAIILVCGAVEHHLQIYDLYVWGDGAIARGLIGFGLGMGLRLASEHYGAPSPVLASLLELVGLTGVVASASLGQGPYIPLFAAALILGLSYERGIVAWALNARWCLWLGRISFSVYLIHEEIIGLVWPHFPASRLPFGHHINGIVWTLMVLAIVLGLGTVTWYCIEEPFRRLGSLLARRIERYEPSTPAPRPETVTAAPRLERPVAG
jgi:peptidoglycan/LPS O-acetylase OafA/YrhL